MKLGFHRKIYLVFFVLLMIQGHVFYEVVSESNHHDLGVGNDMMSIFY